MNDLNHSRNWLLRPRAGCFYDLLLFPVMIAGLVLIPAGRVTAETFTVLHSFTATSANSSGVPTNSDGTSPLVLISSGNTLYGTAGGGGTVGNGTVFKVNADGSGFTNLHSFTGSDGANPGGLISSGNTLYGTARSF